MAGNPKNWQEAVALATQIRDGKVTSYALAANELANYILHEQQAIDQALEFINELDDSKFGEEEPTNPETPQARHTLPFIPDSDIEVEETIVIEPEPRTGVLAVPETGVRPRDVLLRRHNDDEG